MQKQYPDYSEEELERRIGEILVKHVKEIFQTSEEPREVDVFLDVNNVIVVFDESAGYGEPIDDIHIVYTKGKTKKIGYVEFTDFLHVLPPELASLPVFDDIRPISS